MVETVTYLSQALFLGVAIYVVWNAGKRPRRSYMLVVAFFSLLLTVIAYTWVQRIVAVVPGSLDRVLPAVLVLVMPYVLLRLAEEYSSINLNARRVSEAGLVGSIALLLYPGIENILALVAILSYFAAVTTYASRRFHVGSIDANGITRKRLAALSTASILLAISLFTATFTAVLDGIISDIIQIARNGLLFASATFYLVGFAPPAIIRRAWQEPELRHFLHQTLRLPRWSSTDNALRHLENALAETVGAPHATIGLWNTETERIDFHHNSFKPGETIGGRAFRDQRPILSLDTIADDPESRDVYERGSAYAVMAAPIFAEGEPIGVIALYSPNPPIFADDDLSLLTLLADQIGILLENRRHLQAEAELAAREESTRLKDEFLSVAAHDLKTPLTTILATGQYLERRLQAAGEASSELRSVVRLNRESTRLRALVQGLLDASRIEHGQLTTNLETTDLSQLTKEVVNRITSYKTHKVDTHIESDLIVECDPVRIQQVLENLLENAQKYSPFGSEIVVRLVREDGQVHLAITDHGSGITSEDQSKIFDRYYRGRQANAGGAQGIGLGLYICRAIIEQHGGHIWVESAPGEGSTFHVSLRLTGVAADLAAGRAAIAIHRNLTEDRAS